MTDKINDEPTPRLHMRFYNASFMDFDMDHAGYSDALLALSNFRSDPARKSRAARFLAKYAAIDGHKHQALCAEAIAALKETGQ